MNLPSSVVSIHPYFKAHPGKMAAIKELLSAFIEKTATEDDNFYYEFTINGDEIFCREGYADARSVLGHLSNVNAELGEMLKLSDLIRLEFHGPAAEIEKLREPLSGLNPTFFVVERGVVR
ncbi:MAG: hypothetical protein JWL59_1402 [Chthoniobacteraceae bacterium]|nr:hypothetical protein [Chthoniobacteraceae bacterium]